jgi:hypothetical protein
MPVAMQARTLRSRSSLACGAGRKMFIVFRFSRMGVDVIGPAGHPRHRWRFNTTGRPVLNARPVTATIGGCWSHSKAR